MVAIINSHDGPMPRIGPTLFARHTKEIDKCMVIDGEFLRQHGCSAGY
jgi:hypothetical protein